MAETHTVKMEEIGEWMKRYAREHGGLAHVHIHHKPGCPTDHNTAEMFDEVAPKLGQPDALDNVPTCTCGEVEVEICD